MTNTNIFTVFDQPGKRRNKKIVSWSMTGHQNDLCLKLGVEPDDLNQILYRKKKK